MTEDNQSHIAEFALQQFARVYEIEREVNGLSAEQRQASRQQPRNPCSKHCAGGCCCNARRCPRVQRAQKRWATACDAGGTDPVHGDGQLPVDNNWIENQIRPIAIGRNNWLFAGSLRAGQRAAAVMSLIQSAHMNGHDPYAYLRDVMARLPRQRASKIGELLPHRWQSTTVSNL